MERGTEEGRKEKRKGEREGGRREGGKTDLTTLSLRLLIYKIETILILNTVAPLKIKWDNIQKAPNTVPNS